jgi:hypothetical protein
VRRESVLPDELGDCGLRFRMMQDKRLAILQWKLDPGEALSITFSPSIEILLLFQQPEPSSAYHRKAK